MGHPHTRTKTNCQKHQLPMVAVDGVRIYIYVFYSIAEYNNNNNVVPHISKARGKRVLMVYGCTMFQIL